MAWAVLLLWGNSKQLLFFSWWVEFGMVQQALVGGTVRSALLFQVLLILRGAVPGISSWGLIGSIIGLIFVLETCHLWEVPPLFF